MRWRCGPRLVVLQLVVVFAGGCMRAGFDGRAASSDGQVAADTRSDGQTDTQRDAENSHAIGGVLSGLGAGNSVTLQNNGADGLVLKENGAFSFSARVDHGSAYHVTVPNQPAGQTCTVSAGSGTVTNSVTDVLVSCVTLSSYSIKVASSAHARDVYHDGTAWTFGTDFRMGRWKQNRVWSFMYFVLPEEIPGTATITEARMHMVGTESTKIATDRFEIYVQSSCGPGVMDSPDKRPSVDGGSTLLLSEKQMWPETGILVWQLSKANVSPDFAWVVQKLLSGCAGLKAGSAIAVFITGTESFADGTYVGSQDYGVPAEAPELRLSVAIP